ncbi:F-box/LRR-repeat protein 6 isoform X1 [Scomber japonicus]|uniref:F-box/LRR-repeat protein 6 isoform X1 n=1 Tax=Scomber japonicus TaxID=13676 RepID=UPI002306BB34|nr:F-box/LRR-repeat protein 6 isoform X1 [Scomber japonicus]
MDSTEAEVAAHGEESKDTVPSTSNVSNQGEHGPKSNKASLKRKSGSATNHKAKKRKTTRVKRASQPSYTVHEGEDMLLVISSSTSQYDGSAWVPKKKGSKKKKLVKGKGKTVQMKKKKPVIAKPKLSNDYNKVAKLAKEEENTSVFVPEKARDNRWGQSLPEEVLINIFQMVVVQDGAVPFLCRVGRVCRLWNVAASSPVLWRKVTVGHCWIAPGKTQLPKTEEKIKDTLNWLAQNRFSQLRDFSLCHWTKNVDYAVDVVSQFCPHLRSLTFSYCTGMKAQAFQSLGLHSRSLQSINLQHSEFQVEGGLLEYLVNHGNQIRQILFTRGPKNDRLLTAISKGCCPDLEFLEVNKKLDSKDCELPICIQALQIACPKLKTFRMLNVRLLHRTMRNGAELTSGFPLLEELCIATTSYSYMTDKDLLDILFSSNKLRVLDLRGCSRITPAGLATLPCLELECLFWGQYFSSHIGLSTLKKGLHMVTQKWNQTLQQLDIANQLFSEEDLEIAMSSLAQATDADTLRSLNLSGTRITPPALRSVIGQLTALSYLNLSSCRYLPRGVKRVYRGQEDIRQLLDKLE